MVARRLDPCAGRLSAEQIAAGMNADEDNAARLLADAQLLLDAGRYPTAASVAILCIEEAAKVSILRRIATCKDDTERRELWSAYRSHRCKNRHSINPGPGAHPGERHRGFGALAESGTIDILKRVGCYSHCGRD